MGGRASSIGWGVSVSLAVLLNAGAPAGAKYGGGSGVADDPYLIATAEQMNAIGLHPEDWDKCFRLVADIDLNDLSGSACHLIGSSLRSFAGVFDGGGHTISNLTYVVTGSEDPEDSPLAAGFGLFRVLQGPTAMIRDLGLVDPNLQPGAGCQKRLWEVGPLVGSLQSGSVRNCYVQGGQVRGERFVGGLAGSNGGIICDCHAACPVSVGAPRPLASAPKELDRRESFGGLAGSSSGQISNSYATGGATGGQSVGGLVGETSGLVSKSWSAGTVSGESDVGGLVGKCRRTAQVSDCHSHARVSGRAGVGGLAGLCYPGCRIADCFARGGVSATQYAGGLVGRHEGELVRSYSTGCVVADSDFVGGLVGVNRGTITASWAGGHVAGDSCVGGLIGWSAKDDPVFVYNPVVTDSYARGDVRGRRGVGGLIGTNQGGPVLRCYATGKVRGETADSVVNGLVGTSDPTLVKNSFWDIETSGLSTSDAGTGETTAEMQSLLTYLTAGWDFVGKSYDGTDTVWKMCCGRPSYPRLAWEQILVGDFVDPEGVGFEDLAFLAQHWLQTVALPCDSPDLDFYTRIDMKDFALLAQDWRRGARQTIFETTLDTQPAWTAEGLWQFGVPDGRGGTEHGYPDPTGGYIGDNVYGVNLHGDYSVTVDGPHYLTAGPFDCSLYRDVKLRFARWLNTDEADFVRATVEASTDGTLWTALWEHENAEAPLTDESWQVVVSSLGFIADHQEKVYIRWGYEIKDKEAWPMSGWNIDDVILTGVQE